MALDKVAHGPNESSLITVDEAELLARDEATDSLKWRLPLKTRIAAVLLMAPEALPTSPTWGGPWRAALAVGDELLLVVGVDGALYSVEPTLGRVAGKLGPFGPPTAIAASIPSAAIGLAVGETVLLWRRRERRELPVRASALAFSNDGAMLAAGTAEGELRLFDLTAALPKETTRFELAGEVLDVSPHPGDIWIVSTRKGAFSVSAAGLVSALPQLPAGAERVRFDASGRRLAVQRSSRQITVYEWPALEETLWIESADRPMLGLAFGPRDWLGVGLDRGDGNTIDLITSSVRLGASPATSSASRLRIEGPKERLALAKEAEDVRRMTRPYQREVRRWRIAGALLGTGVIVGGLSLGLSLFAKRALPVQSDSPQGCDVACAANRLVAVRSTCKDHPELQCTRAAVAAEDALAAGRCVKAKRALAYIEGHISLRNWNQLLGKELSQAIRGLEEACSIRTEPAAVAPSPLVEHARLVRLEGNELVPSVEPVFEIHPIEGESPLALWVAPDGDVVVATIPNEDAYDPSLLIYRRSASGAWGALRDEHKLPRELGRVSIFGWTNAFVSVVTERNFEDIKTFDGMSWGTELPPVFCQTTIDPAGYIRRRDKDSVITLVRPRFIGRGSCPQGTGELGPLRGLFGVGSSSLWALTRDKNRDVLLQSDSKEWGRWAIRQPPERSGTIDGVWVNATGEAFVATSGQILRTNGTRWSTLPAPPIPVSTLWGRANEDIYGGSSAGLVHFDGATWSKTSYHGRVAALGGTSAAVLVLTTGAGDDAGPAKVPRPSR